MVCNQGHRVRAVHVAVVTLIGMACIRYFFPLEGLFVDAGEVKPSGPRPLR